MLQVAEAIELSGCGLYLHFCRARTQRFYDFKELRTNEFVSVTCSGQINYMGGGSKIEPTFVRLRRGTSYCEATRNEAYREVSFRS